MCSVLCVDRIMLRRAVGGSVEGRVSNASEVGQMRLTGKMISEEFHWQPLENMKGVNESFDLSEEEKEEEEEKR